MRTFSLKESQIKRNWYVVNADGLILGRLAAVVASYLRGKHKPEFSPNMNCGDNIIVINAEKIKVTGNNKLDDHKFYWHTGYPGGIKQRSLRETLTGAHPERAIEDAVRRMLPKGPLGRQMLKGLRVYCGENHAHEGQQPQVLDVASMNAKNIKRS